MKNVICEKCRKPVALRDRFCGNCGSKFLGDAEKVLFPVEGKWGWTLDLVGDLWFEVRGGKITLSNWDEGKAGGGESLYAVDNGQVIPCFVAVEGGYGMNVPSFVEKNKIYSLSEFVSNLQDEVEMYRDDWS